MGLTKEQRPWTTIKDGTDKSPSRVYPAYLIGPSSGAREPDRQPTREDVRTAGRVTTTITAVSQGGSYTSAGSGKQPHCNEPFCPQPHRPVPVDS